MKKIFLAILTACALVSTAHAQTTVIVQQRPGILTDLVNVAEALITLPLAAAEGIVVGTAEAVGALLHGSNDVYIVPQPQVLAPAPVVVAPQPQVVVTAPVVVAPQPQVVVTAPVVAAPQPVTTITTTTRSAGGIVTTTVTRPASAYELGTPLAPVPVEHRVGSSPFVNPYVYRYR